MTPEFWAAWHTWATVFGVGMLAGAVLDRLGRWLMTGGPR